MIASILSWWIVSTVLGWIVLPLVWGLFSRLADRGYGLSRALGLLAAGYLHWIGVSFGLLKNNNLSAIGVVLVIAFAGVVSLRRQGAEFRRWLKENTRLIVTVEILFLIAFIFWSFIRANTPEIQHTEKPMELAFLNAILHSETFPPKDPWLSDFAISYYYFGYILLSFLTKLTGVLASVAFNLGNALWFALTTIGAYSLLYSLFAAGGKKRLFAPLLGPLFVLFIGNLEVVFDILHHQHVFWHSTDPGTTSAFWTWLGLDDLSNPPTSEPTWIPDRFLWWWQASRVIFDVRLDGTSIEMIDEFPFFSFLLADNHPHLLALPFVLIVLAFSLHLFLSGSSGSYKLSTRLGKKIRPGYVLRAVALFVILFLIVQLTMFLVGDVTTLDSLSRVRTGLIRVGLFLAILGAFSSVALGWVEVGLPRVEFWVGAWLLGSLAFLNVTDFPIYMSFLYMIILWNQWKEINVRTLMRVGITYVGLGAFAVLFYLPWYPGYGTQVSGILPNILFPTRIHQFLIMFAPLFLPLLVWLVKNAASSVRELGLRVTAAIAIGIPILLLLFSSILALIAYATLSSDPGMLNSVLGGLGATAETAEGAIRSVLSAALSRRVSGSWTALLLGLTLAMVVAILSTHKLKQHDPQSRLDQAALFVVFLIGIGALLVIGPEFLYVRDSFGHRMNTVFKFYYAAWVLWGIAAGYVTVHLWPRQYRLSQALRLIVLVPLFLGLLYPTLSLWTKTNGFTPANGLTLDGLAYMQRTRPDDYAAIKWINANLNRGVILEAIGGSYSVYGRISTHTGLSTLLGWPYHEYQWRGDFTVQGSREADAAAIYTTDNAVIAQDLINQYGIDYVYVGSLERLKYQPPDYPPINEEKFLTFMGVLYQSGDVTIYANLEDDLQGFSAIQDPVP